VSNIQAFILGLMAAWTPGLIILAWLLRHSIVDEEPFEQTSTPCESTDETTQTTASPSRSRHAAVGIQPAVEPLPGCDPRATRTVRRVARRAEQIVAQLDHATVGAVVEAEFLEPVD
jgi:hypothetical protein